MATIDFKLADIKLESSNTYLLKVRKNLSWDFELFTFFCKNAVLDSQTFNTYLKEN